MLCPIISPTWMSWMHLWVFKLYPWDVGRIAEYGNDKLGTLLAKAGTDKINSEGELYRAMVNPLKTEGEWHHL